jgi:hypothetical protein
MRIAYLILAHDTPSHVGRLVSALAGENSSFLIHIDSKACLGSFEDEVSGDVAFTKRRVSVFWGDFTQVEAILTLIREALADPRHFDRFVLLSGADYPVRSAGYVADFFARNPDKEFINVVPMSDRMGKSLTRLINYRLRPKTPRPIRAIQRGLMILHVLPRTRDYRAVLGDMEPLGGSTWWALTRDACRYIADFASRNPRFLKFHEHTRCPDESFFQTILGNSTFRPRIVRNLTWADWAAGGANPATLGQRHLEWLGSLPSFPDTDQYGPGEILFARKFPDNTAELVEDLQRRIAASESPANRRASGKTLRPDRPRGMTRASSIRR